MNKVVLITGASSGIGKRSAELFAEKGWLVAATMRKPENETELVKNKNIKTFRLDVTDTESIKKCIAEVLEAYGRIDVLVNNAGYGAVGIFEASSDEQIRRQFDTNVFGLMNVTKEILPFFRKEKSGVIINIASIGGKVTFPLYSLYHSTKWAVEGFSESLHYELGHLGIKVKIIEPGVIKTDFYGRSQEVINNTDMAEYQKYLKNVWKTMQSTGNNGIEANIVATEIYKAATDGKRKLRYPIGAPAEWLLPLRKFLPESLFYAIVRMNVEKGIK